MGQKVHPNGLRLGVIRDHLAKWYAPTTEFASTLHADITARDYLEKALAAAAVSRILIERPAPKNVHITIYTARPGVIIGKKGGDVEHHRAVLGKMLESAVHIRIEEVRKPEIDAKLVAETVAQQLEKRIMFRRAMKRAVGSALRAGAKGIKICLSGRLGGAEIARSEWYREGQVPLHTLRADIDYGTAVSQTTYGVIGVKVWIYKGEVLPQAAAPAQPALQKSEEK